MIIMKANTQMIIMKAIKFTEGFHNFLPWINLKRTIILSKSFSNSSSVDSYNKLNKLPVTWLAAALLN